MSDRAVANHVWAAPMLALVLVATAGCDDDRKQAGPDGTYSVQECLALRQTAFYSDTASDSDAAKAQIEYDKHC